MEKFKTTQQKQAHELVVSPPNDAASDWLLYSAEYRSRWWRGLFKPGEQGMTPPLLVEQMVAKILSNYKSTDKLPKILDPCSGTGSFLFCIFLELRKKYNGVSPLKIFKNCIHAWDIDEKKIKLLRNEFIKLLRKCSPFETREDIETAVNKNIIVKDALDEYNNSMTMKFDVIIGNPPYNADSNAKKKLWPEFVKQALRVEPQQVTFVTPTSWAYGDKRYVSEVRSLLAPHLRYADLNASRFFPGIGEDISYWHYCKSHKGPTELLTLCGTRTHDFGTRYIDDDNRIFDDIEKKVLDKEDKLKLQHCHFKRATLREEMDTSYRYMIQYSASQTLYSDTLPPDYYSTKVFINRSGYYWNKKNPDKYIRILSEGVAGRLAAHIIVEDASEAEHLLGVLRSKLFIFLIQMNETKNTQFKDDIYRLPRLDWGRSWSDAELYQHFNLTRAEIAHIEGVVK